MAYVTSDNKDQIKLTSSLNKYFMCHYCNRQFKTKCSVQKHVHVCLNTRTCGWCKLEFKNRGNLVTHALHVHGDKSYKKATSPRSTCEVCNISYVDNLRLRYHIRSKHFNLFSKTPWCEKMEINQVWFERVFNSNVIAEIKKKGHNILLIRKFDSNKPVTVRESTNIEDLSDMYPTGHRKQQIKCDICDRWLIKRDFKKHYDEKHAKIKKHHCDNCNTSFKRSYFFVRHICNKPKPRRGRMNIVIEKSESLNPIVV